MTKRKRRSAKIHVLPGVERRDLAGAPIPSVEVLQEAISNGVTDVIVIGKDRAGNLYLAGAPPDVDRSVGMLMRAVALLADCRIVNDVVISTDDNA